MAFERRQVAELGQHVLFGDPKSVGQRLLLKHLGQYGTGRDGRPAAERLKRGFFDLVSLDPQKKSDDIAAHGVAHIPDAVGIGHLPDVPGVDEMFHQGIFRRRFHTLNLIAGNAISSF